MATRDFQTGAVGYQDHDWMNKTPVDFYHMDVQSLKMWIRRIRDSKKRFQKTSKQGQTHLVHNDRQIMRPLAAPNIQFNH